MAHRELILQALSEGDGAVRLAPCWVPRSFLMPGGRLKLDPRDLYALGAHRGGIDERWFSSTRRTGPERRTTRASATSTSTAPAFCSRRLSRTSVMNVWTRMSCGHKAAGMCCA